MGKKEIDVIVADDHFFYRKGLTQYLSGLPFVKSVTEAENGSRVLALLQTGKFDLVFMDYKMPVMNGETAAILIHTHHPHVSVIATSLYEDAFTIRRMALAGCKAFIGKSTSSDEITRALSAVLAGKRYFNDSVLEKLTRESEEECFARLHKIYGLSDKEFIIIGLICDGLMNKVIADKMAISTKAVEKYRSTAFHKLGVTNVADLLRFAIRHNIISVDTI